MLLTRTKLSDAFSPTAIFDTVQIFYSPGYHNSLAPLVTAIINECFLSNIK